MANVLQIEGAHIRTRQQQQLEGGRWCSDLAVLPAPIAWRPFQFRSPAQGYMYRARISAPAMVSTPIVRRQAQVHKGSISSIRMPQLGTASKIHGTSCHQQKPEGCDTELSLTAQPVTMQPRPPQRPACAFPSRAASIHKQPFSYPDPTKVKCGNISFDVRLAELAKLEKDTIRHEEYKNQLSNKRTLRPSSAVANLRSASPNCRIASQTVQQVSRSISTSADKRLSTCTTPRRLSRKASLPATLKPSSYSRPVSAESCSSISECGAVSPVAATRPNETFCKPELHSQTLWCPPTNEYPASTESQVEGRESWLNRTPIPVIAECTATENGIEPEWTITDHDMFLPNGERASRSDFFTDNDDRKSPEKKHYNQHDDHDAQRKHDCDLRCSDAVITLQTKFENEEGEIPVFEAVTVNPRCPELALEVDDLEVTSVVCVELNNDSTQQKLEEPKLNKTRKSKKMVRKKVRSGIRSHGSSALDHVSSDTSMTSSSQCSLKSTKSTRARRNTKGKVDSKTIKAK